MCYYPLMSKEWEIVSVGMTRKARNRLKMRAAEMDLSLIDFFDKLAGIR